MRSARALVLLALVAVLMAVPIQGAGRARGANVPFDLYGSLSGWGFTPTSITSPGPQITVSVGDVVTLKLFSEDKLTHRFFIDYNGNGTVDPVEPTSPPFSSSTTYSFTASQAGTFTYWCSIHFNKMKGPWTTQGGPPTNTPPTVSFSSPGAGARWSGGSQHQVTWAMGDAQDPAAYLHVWLNLTLDMTTTPLVNNQAGVTSYAWSVPFANTSALLHLDVVDTGGLVGSSSTTLTIDSTRPRVEPSGIAYGSQAVTISFSEAMAPSTSPQDIALLDVTASAWVPGTLTWGGGNTNVTFRPVSVLEPGHAFRVFVNGTLRDASDPGNPLAQAVTYDFTVPGSTPPSPQGIDAGRILLTGGIAAGVAVVAIALLMRRRRGR